jgi:bacterioferritin-associated ferredoxin
VYVCICNNVTERDIAQAVRAGARTLDCLAHRLAVSTCCGQCRDIAHECLEAALGGSGRATYPTPARTLVECVAPSAAHAPNG